MADDGEALTITVIDSLKDVSRAAWDALANPPDAPFNPFIGWDFLQALEETGCVGARSGWTPLHLLAHDRVGGLVGAMPLYAKEHSQGEYVFDHAWADAFYRAGGHYYPKLQCAVPFTPAAGPRVFAADNRIEAGLVNAAVALTRRAQASSLHITFVEEQQASRLAGAGLMLRTGLQYHWLNAGYRQFDDFLAALSSQKRKNIRKERARAQEGLTIRRLRGDDIKPAHWDYFFRCYMDTGSRKWGSPYLNRAFFHLIGARMGVQIVLFIAEEDGQPIAAALNFLGGEALYGRYWGQTHYRDFLHFELCYYQAIELAIELGLARVEAGAQGAHKLARGYAPKPTYSAHWIGHAGLSDAIARYLEHETPAMIEEIEAQAEHAPFKKDA
ncbi:MAG: GNAT family N-acetyltransferase [Hyphomonadaceae bacterium]